MRYYRIVGASLLAALSLISATTVACKAGRGGGLEVGSLGLLPIGAVPRNMEMFVSSDCDLLLPKLSDCSAQDKEGRRYTFFDGALSKISAANNETKKSLRLPANLKFGEDIALSAKKISLALNINLSRGTSYDGKVVYSSDFIIESSKGVLYSIELIADSYDHLSQVVERVDY